MKNLFLTSKMNRSFKGQSITEFAILLPILMLILIGILDLGRITATYVVVANAAREGARFGSLHPNNATGVTNRARAEAQNSVVIPAQLQVSCVTPTPTPASCDGAIGSPIRVRATYPFSFITTYLFAGMSTVNVTVESTFQIQKD